MSTRPAFTQHNEWADSMADWAEHQHLERERLSYLSRDYGPKDRAEGAVYAVYAPQGRAEQGWRVRNSAEPMPVVVDKLPEDYDQGERTAMTSADAWALMGIYIASVLVSVGLASFLAGLL